LTRDPGDASIKTFTLRDIKDSPPYLHDGRLLLTLGDTVEFFNLVLGAQLATPENSDLVAYAARPVGPARGPLR
jgi:cytochrome c peroxidase